MPDFQLSLANRGERTARWGTPSCGSHRSCCCCLHPHFVSDAIPHIPNLTIYTGDPTYLFWLNEFFITHLSVPDSPLLQVIRNAGKVLAFGGLVLFAIHAAYLYWMKLVRKAIATRLLYAYVRHPQYACWIAAGLGLAILWPRFINLCLWFGMTFAYWALATHEEQAMKRRHGGAYSAYLTGKGMFLPKLRLRTPPFVRSQFEAARRC